MLLAQVFGCSERIFCHWSNGFSLCSIWAHVFRQREHDFETRVLDLNFYVLHRVAGAMIPMVRRTSGFIATKSILKRNCILTFPFAAHCRQHNLHFCGGILIHFWHDVFFDEFMKVDFSCFFACADYDMFRQVILIVLFWRVCVHVDEWLVFVSPRAPKCSFKTLLYRKC